MLVRPVHAGWGSLVEVYDQWSVDELVECHNALDAMEEAQALYIEGQTKGLPGVTP